MTAHADRRMPGGTPERQRTLAEACDLYFPGVTPCALRWMIKRRGYGHSRWGREYRLTDSQIAAIQEDMARPPEQAGVNARRPSGAATKPPAGNPRAANPPGRAPTRRRRQVLPVSDVKQTLAERLASPLTITAITDSRPADRRQA
jgi:hypothetical protein